MSSCRIRKSTSSYRPVAFFVVAMLLANICASPAAFRPTSASRSFSTTGRSLQGLSSLLSNAASSLSPNLSLDPSSLGCRQTSSRSGCFRRSGSTRSGRATESGREATGNHLPGCCDKRKRYITGGISLRRINAQYA
eukprot:GHVS01040115.1.p1 GENE.GHVS01040115.1~~GHVS01040115.1.p1  ORF type:complete len:137 (+),score=16.70 GHVS01040115.1:214-624(+)